MKAATALDYRRIRAIALVRLSALGDVTLMLPVVRTLQQVLPQARITWITGTGAYQLLKGITGVEFEVVEKPRGPRDYLAFRRRFLSRRFDVLLAAQASLRANLLYPWISAPLKIGFDRIRARDGQWLFTNRRIPFARQHLLNSFFAFIETLGIRERVLEWGLPMDKADKAWVGQQLPRGDGPLLVVNPGASKAERVWLRERYVEVIRIARQRWNARLVLTGGPDATEQALARAICNQVDDGITNLVGRTTPKQLIAVLARADCLLAPDTGPAHIAVAVGTPVVGLYAVAPAWLSAPYLSQDLVVDRYAEAVRRILRVDPGKVPWAVRVHKGHPMALIEVDDVVQKLARVLSATR